MNDRLKIAMANADIEEIEAAADAIGVAAIQNALARTEIVGSAHEEAQRTRDEVEAQRVRDLDAGLADVVEIVNRHRVRLGRRGVSRHDGETIRRMFELLRAMQPENGTDALR